MSEYLFDGPEHAPAKFILTHGAGSPMDSPLLTTIARGLAESGIRVIRFEFPYMRSRRKGGRRPPDRQPILLSTWREAIESVGERGRLFIGGHSMGGRMASMIADDMKVAGLCCISYPFHPPDDLTRLRTAHLEGLVTPALFIQGTRDPFGTPDEVAGYGLPSAIRVHWLPYGDHSLKSRRGSGRTTRQNINEAIGEMVEFVRSLFGPEPVSKSNEQ